MHARIKLLSNKLGLIWIALSLSAALYASDFSAETKPWEIDAGIERNRLPGLEEKRRDAKLRLVDFESYKSGRSYAVTALWAQSDKGEKWNFESGVNISEFKASHEKNVSKGFAITEVEVDRVGASLQFAGAWVKSKVQQPTVFHYGMDDLLFSNRYGEMADRGYRLIDFEAYEAQGSMLYAAIWTRNEEGLPVRFYRGLDFMKFQSISQSLEKSGFRIFDVEGYETEDGMRFAGQWVKLTESQDAFFAFNMLAAEFYEKNSEYEEQGFRMVDFEAYSMKADLRYAGAWVKDDVIREEPEKDRDAFLDAFRDKEG